MEIFLKSAENPLSLEHSPVKTEIKMAEHSFAGGQR